MHILFLTTNDRDFRSLKSLIKIFAENKQYLTTVAITGSHLANAEQTQNKFQAEKIPIDLKLENIVDGVDFAGALKFSFLIPQLTGFFAFKKPDVLIISGDSSETFSAACTAFLSKIPIVHLQGGEKTFDSFKNNLRYAISRLASIHFVATKEGKNRLKATGEPADRIHVVGAPELDSLLAEKIAPPSAIEKKFNVKLDNYILLIQHPEPGKTRQTSRHITQTLAALREFKTPIVAFEPEKESGSDTIFSAIKSEAKKLTYFNVHKNLPREEFLGLLRNCRFLLGNSSLGIVEATTFGRIAINLGDRQGGREHAYNVIDVAIKAKDIVETINKVSDKLVKRAKTVKNVYGDGNSGEKIFEIFKSLKIDEKLLDKTLNL